MNVCSWHRGEAVLKLLRRLVSCENLFFFGRGAAVGSFIEAGRLVEFSQRFIFFFF